MSKLTWKKTAALVMTVTMLTTAAAGCGNNASSSASSEESSTSSTVESSESSSEESSAASATEEETDEMAAKNVADLIDAIYVQERNDNTDEECKAAKEAWDALTDAQKELVEGDNADPDYFGRDTGDAAKDDPRNEDEIGENELLVVSFGTSFNDSRVKDIKGIEDALQEAYPDWSVRRAFTAQIIINHVQARDDEKIDNMQQALDRAVANGVKNLVVQPTHLMGGLEYTDVKDELDKYADKFDKISLGDPLLTSDDDYKKVAAAIKENMASFDDGKTALCLMGHGTEADSNADYAKMQEVFKNEGLTQFFVGTVEAEPTCEDVIAAASAAGYKKAVLAPFMVVAGDHANNDMADETDPDSWAAKFVAAGFEVTCLLQGLGQNVAVDDIYVSHVDDAIAKL